MNLTVKAFFLWVLLQLPLLVLLMVQQPFADLFRLILPVLLYQILVLGFIYRHIFNRSTWLRLKAIIHALSKSAFLRRYHQQIIFDHRIFNVRGLRTTGTFTLELEQVFVDLRIAPSANPQRANMDPLAVRELTGNRPIWQFIHHMQYRSDTMLLLAIIGAPGCGKTTLLQHMALILAHNRQHSYGLSPRTPLLLFLRNHIQAITEQQLLLADLTQQTFSDDHKYPYLHPPDKFFARQLQRGHCVVLLDGLDEIADLPQRRQVSDWIAQQVRHYPRCLFIITARPQGYLDAPVNGAHVLEVQSFNTSQVHHFIKGWYLANEVISFGNRVDYGVRQRARQGAEDLIKRLHNQPTLNALTVNPLLLTMIAMVHRYRGQLPGRRVELYDEICNVLLGLWRESIGMQDSLTAAQKRVVLQPLAAHMMIHNVRDINTTEATRIIREPLESVGLSSEYTAQFLNDIQASSGLLLEREPGCWSFAHLTFQEYLCAADLLEQKVPLAWQSLVENSWWHETLRLYAAQGNATPLVRTCLDNGSIPAMMLAADCLEEARQLDVNLRREALARLVDDLESTDFQRRRLAAEVRLKQRLGSLQRIDDQLEIDNSYLSCAEYQLFLDEQQQQGNFYQPDHWAGYQFPIGMAQQPITGLRASDADAFCAWLNEQQGYDVHYRLPTPAESHQHPAETDDYAALCRDAQGCQLIGLSVTQQQQYSVRLNELSILPMPSDLMQHCLVDKVIQALHSYNLRNLDLIRVQALNQALAFEFSGGGHFTFDYEGERALTFDFERAFMRDLYQEQVHAKDLAHAIDTALGTARALDLARDIDNRAFSRALVLVRDLARDITELNDARASALAYELAEMLSRDLAQTRDMLRAREREDAREQIRHRALAMARALALGLARALAMVSQFDAIHPKIKFHVDKARQRASTIMDADGDIYMKRLATLIHDLLGYIDAERDQKRHAWLRYLSHTAEYIWLGYEELDATDVENQRWWHRWWQPARRRNRLDYSRDRAMILKFCWWLQITLARADAENPLPAWEGIRLIREHRAVEESGKSG